MLYLAVFASTRLQAYRRKALQASGGTRKPKATNQPTPPPQKTKVNTTNAVPVAFAYVGGTGST